MAGFQLSKTQGASGYTGKVQDFTFLSGNSDESAIGDAVIVSGTASTEGIAAIGRAAGSTGTEITGIINGFAPDLSNLELKGRTTLTERITKVQVDPNALYEIEIGSALTASDVSSNLLLTANAPTTTGNLVRSAMVTGAVDAAGPLRLIRLIPATDGTALGAVGNLALVSIIRSQQTNLVGV